MLHPDDNRTFLGGLATVGYKVMAFGLLVSFAIMFFYYNENVQQAIVPQTESLVELVVADVEIDIRILGYTGRCPAPLSANESYISRLENFGATHRYTAGDVTIEDAGWIGNQAIDPEETEDSNANDTKTNGTDEVAVTNATTSLRGSTEPTASESTAYTPSLSLIKLESSWQKKYMMRSVHDVYCEQGYLPFDPYAFDADENATKNATNSSSRLPTNSSSRRLARAGGGRSSSPSSRASTLGGGTLYGAIFGDDGSRIGYYVNGTNVTGPKSHPDHGPVLRIKWKCEACTLQRVGALAIKVKGVTDEYAVSASAYEYDVKVSPVIPLEDNSVRGFITPLEKTNVFRGAGATRQKLTFMPATYTADNLNIFGQMSYRVQFDATEVGETIDREKFIDFTNELNFVVDFSVGGFQFNTRITPKMTFMNALCELGGLFGAVAGMYIGWMVFLEKHEKFVPKKVKAAMTKFDKGNPDKEVEVVEEGPVTLDDLVSKVEATHIIVGGMPSPNRLEHVPVTRPGVEIDVGVRVKVVGATYGHRKLNGTFGWVETVEQGDGMHGHHGFGVRMEADNRLNIILRRYLMRMDDTNAADVPVKYAGGDAALRVLQNKTDGEEKQEEEDMVQLNDPVSPRALSKIVNAKDVDPFGQMLAKESPLSLAGRQLAGPPPQDDESKMGYGADLPGSLEDDAARHVPMLDLEPLVQPNRVVITDFVHSQFIPLTTAPADSYEGAGGPSGAPVSPKAEVNKTAIGGTDDFDRSFLSSNAVPAVSKEELEARLVSTVGGASVGGESSQRDR
jgi:hypothetical protein